MGKGIHRWQREGHPQMAKGGEYPQGAKANITIDIYRFGICDRI